MKIIENVATQFPTERQNLPRFTKGFDSLRLEVSCEVGELAVRNRFKEIRHDHRMNQIEFSSYIGVNRQLYNRWENQATQPSLEWVLKIAQRIKKSVEEIVYLDESE